jgi:hypothetical protein
MIKAALVCTVGAEAALLLGGSRFIGLPGLLLVVLASAAWALVAYDPRVEVRPHFVVLAVAVVFAIAIAVPPRTSHDLWSYVMYGRTVTVHHASPYIHAPSDYPHDPFVARIGRGWRSAKSVYGPLFTGVSAALARFGGSSALRARLAFQGLSALGVGGALLLIWRTTRSARAVAFLGLHPVVVTAIVNGGHNDALVGLAVLAGALLAARRRWSGAGVVIGLGILVKASTGLGLLGIAAWSFRKDRRGAMRLTAAAGATAIAGYLPAGSAAVRAAARAGSNGFTRGSPLDPVSTVTHISSTTAFAMVLAFVAFVAYRKRTASQPTTTALATTAAYLITGAYVLPWYSAWALPAAAVERRSVLAVLVGAQAAFLVALYEYEAPAHTTLTGVLAIMRTVVIQIGAWSAVVALVVALAIGRGVRARRPTG